ncbi:MAG: YggT family protein [Gammaproteobacteria bacterium]|jgi:YggT family protein
MADQMINSFLVLFQIALYLFSLALVLRFILQAVRADFYNPFSQAIVKITDPVVRPTRRVIPPMGGLDLASLLLALVSLVIRFYVPVLVGGISAHPVAILIGASFFLLDLFLRVFLWALILVVVLSWLTLLNVASPGNLNPLVRILDDITRPMLDPIRRFVPPVGGLDFSVLVALAVIFVLRNLLYGLQSDLFA